MPKFLRGKTWWVSYYLDGRQYRKSLGTRDETVAEYLAKKILLEIQENRKPAALRRDILDKVFDEWKTAVAAEKKQDTHTADTLVLDVFFKWGKFTRLSDITPASISRYLKHKVDSGCQPTSANRSLRNIRAFLNWSIRAGYLLHNPCRMVRALIEPRKPPRFLIKEEIDILLKIAKDQDPDLHLMIATAIYTGLRLGELLRLKWGDIDLNKGVLMVRESKSATFRSIPLNSHLADLLSDYYGKKDALCFNETNLRKRLENLLEAAIKEANKNNVKVNLAGIGWHTFRKTFGSQLAMAGVSIFKISKWLGHTDPKITVKHYAHLLPEKDKDIDKF